MQTITKNEGWIEIRRETAPTTDAALELRSQLESTVPEGWHLFGSTLRRDKKGRRCFVSVGYRRDLDNPPAR